MSPLCAPVACLESTQKGTYSCGHRPSWHASSVTNTLSSSCMAKTGPVESLISIISIGLFLLKNGHSRRSSHCLYVLCCCLRQIMRPQIPAQRVPSSRHPQPGLAQHQSCQQEGLQSCHGVSQRLPYRAGVESGIPVGVFPCLAET